MRWIEPKDGDIKIKKKFAILPITINNETRWLEWVTVKYQYYTCRSVSIGCVASGWFPEEFVDKEEFVNKKKELVSIKDISPIVAEYYTEFETIEERDSYIEKVKKYCKENNIPCYLDSEYSYNKPMTFEQFEKIYYSPFPDRRNGGREGWIRYEYK